MYALNQSKNVISLPQVMRWAYICYRDIVKPGITRNA